MNRRKSPAKSRLSQDQGVFRIIGGHWRGRKLSFPATDGLRPTPDRVRETLFNWLSMDIRGSRCLDLCAGSGALGLEALSRGAEHCLFIDSERRATSAIEQHLKLLPEAEGSTLAAPLPQALQQLDSPVDLVFLDPPYALDIVSECLQILIERQLLKPDALVYIEVGSDRSLPAMPDAFQLHRHKKAGQVQYALLQLCSDCQPD